MFDIIQSELSPFQQRYADAVVTSRTPRALVGGVPLHDEAIYAYIRAKLLEAEVPTRVVTTLVDMMNAYKRVDGELIEDWTARGRAVENYLKLIGAFEKRKKPAKHLHVHLDKEPPEVLEFIAKHGRMPSSEEKAGL